MSEVAVQTMSEHDARRLTERIRIAAVNFADSRDKLVTLVQEAKDGSAHLALGYESWTGYLEDVLGDEPMRVARDVRPELVELLSAHGMPNTVIAKTLGVTDMTVHRDLEKRSTNVEREPRTVTRTDGQVLTIQPRPEPAEPIKPRAEPVAAQFTAAIVDLNKIMSRLRRISESQNFTKNKSQIATLHGSDLARTIGELETLAESLN